MQDNIKRGNIICFTEEQVERASEYAKGLAENYGLKTLLLNKSNKKWLKIKSEIGCPVGF